MVALVCNSVDWVIDYVDIQRKTKEAYLIILESIKEFINIKMNMRMTGQTTRRPGKYLRC